MGGGCTRANPKVGLEGNLLCYYDSGELFLYNQSTESGKKILLKSMTGKKEIKYRGCIRIRKSIYLMGGEFPQDAKCIANTDMFVADSLRLVSKGKMLIAKMHMAVTSVWREKYLIFVLGGFNWKDLVIQTCEKYSIEKNKWVLTAPLNQKKSHVSACSFQNELIFGFGGFDRYNFFSTIEKLEVSQEQYGWEIVTLNREGRWNPIFASASLQFADNLILVFGGRFHQAQSDTYVETDASFIFNIDDLSMKKISKLATPAAFQMSQPFFHHKSKFIYGLSDYNLHIYDIENGSWKTTQIAFEYIGLSSK
jgi:hypothetical protein